MMCFGMGRPSVMPTSHENNYGETEGIHTRNPDDWVRMEAGATNGA